MLVLLRIQTYVGLCILETTSTLRFIRKFEIILVIWVYLVDKVNMMDLEILVILVILLNFANLVTLLI